ARGLEHGEPELAPPRVVILAVVRPDRHLLIENTILSSMFLPRLCLVRQKFPDRRIPDVAAEVRRQLGESGFAARLRPGARVAIGVGSRGIHNIATIVRNVVGYWKDQGMHPFIFPAMGSH